MVFHDQPPCPEPRRTVKSATRQTLLCRRCRVEFARSSRRQRTAWLGQLAIFGRGLKPSPRRHHGCVTTRSNQSHAGRRNDCGKLSRMTRSSIFLLVPYAAQHTVGSNCPVYQVMRLKETTSLSVSCSSGITTSRTALANTGCTETSSRSVS
jgi:hypothetical protein